MNFLLILAASVTLAWEPVPETDIALYQVYVATLSMKAGNPPLVGFPVDLGTQFTVEGIEFERQYFFVVTAVNLDGEESGYSNEVQCIVPLPTPTPEATPEHPGNAAGWWKNFFNQ